MKLCDCKWLGGLIVTTLLLTTAAVPAAMAQQQDFLDVSISIFSPPAPETTATESSPVTAGTGNASLDITPEIRAAEARYLALYLRYRLEASGSFGAVRVLPLPDDGAHLKITGAITRSDGRTLTLAISATDSTGRNWLDKSYSGEAVATESLNDDVLGEEAFAYVFGAIVKDLQTGLEQQTAQEIDRIRAVALLNYGAGLSPQRYAGYIQENGEGRLELVGLPAANDPLLSRIQEIREHEYLFIDVVDQEYRRFYQDIKPVYDMWRRFRREQADTAEVYAERENSGDSQFRPGSYYALQETYNNYRWAKLQELYLDELSEGFANETEATSIELEDTLFRLTGTLEQQYREWRSILAEMANLETP